MTTDRKQDYYDVLGVPRNASPEDIKKAFRRLAMQYHPDRNQDGGAEARFKEVNEAYEILSDPDRRAMYDRFGHAAAQGGENPFARNFEGFGFGGLGDIFDAFFGGAGSRTQRGPARGSDSRSHPPKSAASATACALSPAPSRSVARNAAAPAKSAARSRASSGSSSTSRCATAAAAKAASSRLPASTAAVSAARSASARYR